MEDVLQFLYGGLTVICLLIGVFFVNFWRVGQPRDRFFLLFAAAFWALGASWCVHVLFVSSSETRPQTYVLRVVAFLIIIAAIVDKNRRVARDV